MIDADPDALYGMVSDLPRMGEWSPECERVDWEGDVTGPVAGTTFVGHNAVGPGRRIRWSRHGTVLVADPGREFAFITDEGGRDPPRGATGSNRVDGGRPGSPSPTRSAGSPHGPASSTSPPTATRSCSTACAPPSSASRTGPRVHRRRHRSASPTRRHSHDDLFTATPGVDVITTTADIPALGSLAINAFVLHGPDRPGRHRHRAGADEFMAALRR